MKRFRNSEMFILVIVSLLGAIYFLQTRIDNIKATYEKPGDQFLYLPDAKYLKVASLGYENIVADFLWLDSIQHIGSRKITGEGYQWIYKALDTVTTLSPHMQKPYEVGGLILTVSKDDPEMIALSTKLLQKGMDNNPDVWQFPFYLGFNSMFYAKDYKKAAYYMSRAATIKGSPSYLPLLSARLYVQAENPYFAYEFLSRIYDTTTDERAKSNILNRLNLIKSEIIRHELQMAADAYKAKTGHAPASIGVLVKVGIIRLIPEDPNGGQYYMGTDGRVLSTTTDKQNAGVYSRGN